MCGRWMSKLIPLSSRLDSRARFNRLQAINDNQPNQETLHKPSKWFSQLTFSTPPRPLRPASTSSRPSCPLPAPSSWTSSAPDASPSPPSSRTPTQSSSARAARRSCKSRTIGHRIRAWANAFTGASPLVARRD
ncbi:40S ribosomal protein S27 [Alternaria sp. MG1]|nr:40S ribosomal protein S27 [Alternaria sp. MG1]